MADLKRSNTPHPEQFPVGSAASRAAARALAEQRQAEEQEGIIVFKVRHIGHPEIPLRYLRFGPGLRGSGGSL